MRRGKKPTRKQKIRLGQAGLAPENWLVDSLKEQLRQKEIKLAKYSLPADLYRDLWMFVTDEAKVSRERMASAADIMAEMADAPQDIAFTRAVTIYREAKERAQSCERMASALDDREPEGV